MLVQRKIVAILLALFTVCLWAVPANVSAEYVCGQDLDGDGYSDGEGETAECLSMGADWQCPVGAVDCVKDEVEPICPEGGTFNPDHDMCQIPADVSCPSGYAFDAEIDRCVLTVECSEGGVFNPVTDHCEKLVQNECPLGYTYDAAQELCKKAVDCFPGVLDVTSDRCETPSNWDCPTGYTYDSSLLGCTGSPSCSSGSTYNAARNRCENAVSNDCPSGFGWDTTINKCVAAATCTDGSILSPTADKCELAAPGSCPIGYAFNASRNICEETPTCSVPGSYSSTRDKCLANSLGTTCPSDYSYDPGLGVCIASPVCVGGTYNTATNACEATPTYSCPDSTYAYNSSRNRCEKPPVCSQGTYSATYNKCLLDFTKGCPSGYSYAAVRDRCEIIPVCNSGYTYNAAIDRCVSNTPTCPAGYTWNGSTCVGTFTETIAATQMWACVLQFNSYPFPATTVGGIIETSDMSNTTYRFGAGCYFDAYRICSNIDENGLCLGVSKWIGISIPPGGNHRYNGQNHYNTSYLASSCPAGYSLSGSTCSRTITVTAGPSYDQQFPTCPSGSMDYANDICFASYTPSCPAGMSYDSPSNKCVLVATCSNGWLDTNLDKCYQGASGGCPSGYSLNGNTCQKTPGCTSPGSFATSWDLCSATGTINCPSGYVWNADSSKCEKEVTCSYPGSLNGTVDQCQAAYTLVCPSGFTLGGSLCTSSPSCASPGTYSPSIDKCSSFGTKICTTGTTFDSTTQTCWIEANCGAGSLNIGDDRCESPATANCGAWIWDGTNQVCHTSTVCDLGSYNATANECLAAIFRNCGSYLWNEMETKCSQGVQCPNYDPVFPTSNTIVFSSELNICVANSQHDCPTNYGYNGLPVAMCESVKNCAGGGVYNPENNQCVGEAGICPLGSQYVCRGEQGATQCSPNTCFDLSVAGNDDADSSPDDLMLKSDGNVDDEGNCLDQIYIFSGTGSRCRPPGVTVGTLNNCCDSDEPVMSDAKTGNRISQSISAITTAYEIGQVAYYGSALATGSASIVAVSGTTGAITTMTVVTAGGATTTLTGAAATGAYGALASGATTTAGAVSAGMQSYAVALFNPATIAFTAVAYVAIKILMGNGCDQRDIMTSMLRDSGNCHELGKMCDRRWKGVGCVQRSKRYCCFNSKMGRIIHEQGRPQLLTFGLDGAWGTPSEPNCRGFTTDEFQMLDFSKIDMSEYFADMQAGLQESIEGAQQKALEKVQQHYDQTLL